MQRAGSTGTLQVGQRLLLVPARGEFAMLYPWLARVKASEAKPSSTALAVSCDPRSFSPAPRTACVCCWNVAAGAVAVGVRALRRVRRVVLRLRADRRRVVNGRCERRSYDGWLRCSRGGGALVESEGDEDPVRARPRPQHRH